MPIFIFSYATLLWMLVRIKSHAWLVSQSSLYNFDWTNERIKNTEGWVSIWETFRQLDCFPKELNLGQWNIKDLNLINRKIKTI
jgi:hypothetical protein